ncbi:MAG: DinB family protein [Flavobacteriaceae bacterium]|nr:DinB family protein [Flavobacteriaceae bacterium]
MEKQLDIIKNHREILLSLIADLNQEQLCKIPNGFNNNVIWNVGHILVTQQMLTYGLSNLSYKIDKELVDKYRKGSIAMKNVSTDEINQIKELLVTTLDTLESDLQQNKFASFNHYKTSMGLELNSITDCIPFMAYHEGIHLGIILSLIKFVKISDK